MSPRRFLGIIGEFPENARENISDGKPMKHLYKNFRKKITELRKITGLEVFSR